MVETILQHWILTQFAYPFLFIFLISYALLVKSKLLGENQQVNAIVSLILGLVFVTALEKTAMFENLILFLTLALVIVMMVLMIWGFATGSSLEKEMFTGNFKWVLLGITVVAVFIAVLWAAGIQNSFFDLLFYQSWSESLWTNIAFVVVVIVALTVAIKGVKS